MEETRTRRGWRRLGYIPLKKYFDITATEYRRSQVRKMTARDISVEPLKKRVEKEKLKVVNCAVKNGLTTR